MKIVGPPWGDLDQCRLAGFEQDDVDDDDDNDNENMLDRPLSLKYSLLEGCETFQNFSIMTKMSSGQVRHSH